MGGQRFISDNSAQKAQLATVEIDLLDLAVDNTTGVRKAFINGGTFDVLAVPLNIVPISATAEVIDATDAAATLMFKLNGEHIGSLAADLDAEFADLTIPYGAGGVISVEVGAAVTTVKGKILITILYGQIGRSEEVHGA
jgi:hypothetical protein